MQKKILLTAAALAIVGTTLLAAQQAFAQSTTTTSDPMSSLVEKISTKFGLDKNEVRAVFDEARQARMAEMQKFEEERLSKLVSDGKITESQKQLIIAKRKELMAQHQSEHESLHNMSAEERRATMEKYRQSLEDWAEQNGIDLQYVWPFKMKGEHGMRGMMPQAE